MNERAPGPEAMRIIGAFAERDGLPVLAPAAKTAFVATLSARPPDEALAAELCAFALQVARVGGEAGRDAVADLLEIAAAACGDADQAAAVFAEAGFSADARRQLGLDVSTLRPADGPKPANARTPFQLLIERKRQ